MLRQLNILARTILALIAVGVSLLPLFLLWTRSTGVTFASFDGVCVAIACLWQIGVTVLVIWLLYSENPLDYEDVARLVGVVFVVSLPGVDTYLLFLFEIPLWKGVLLLIPFAAAVVCGILHETIGKRLDFRSDVRVLHALWSGSFIVATLAVGLAPLILFRTLSDGLVLWSFETLTVLLSCVWQIATIAVYVRFLYSEYPATYTELSRGATLTTLASVVGYDFFLLLLFGIPLWQGLILLVPLGIVIAIIVTNRPPVLFNSPRSSVSIQCASGSFTMQHMSMKSSSMITETIDRLVEEAANKVRRFTRIELPESCHISVPVTLEIQLTVSEPPGSLVAEILEIPFLENQKETSVTVFVTASAFSMTQRIVSFTVPIDRDSQSVSFKLIPLFLGSQIVEIEMFNRGDRIGYYTVQTEVVE